MSSSDDEPQQQQQQEPYESSSEEDSGSDDEDTDRIKAQMEQLHKLHSAKQEALKQKKEAAKAKRKKKVIKVAKDVEVIKSHKPKRPKKTRKIFIDPDDLSDCEQDDLGRIQIVMKRRKKGRPRQAEDDPIEIYKVDEEVIEEGHPKKKKKMTKKDLNWNVKNDEFQKIKKHNPKAKQLANGAADNRTSRERTPAQRAAFLRCQEGAAKARALKQKQKEEEARKLAKETGKTVVEELAKRVPQPPPPVPKKKKTKRYDDLFDFGDDL